LISVSPDKLLTKITQEELTKLMGGIQSLTIELSRRTPRDLDRKVWPRLVRTTFSLEIRRLLKKQGKQVLLVACEFYRPAAIDQD